MKPFQCFLQPDHRHERGKYRDQVDEQPCPVGSDERNPLVPAEIGYQRGKQGKVENTEGDGGVQAGNAVVMAFPQVNGQQPQ